MRLMIVQIWGLNEVSGVIGEGTRDAGVVLGYSIGVRAFLRDSVECHSIRVVLVVVST